MKKYVLPTVVFIVALGIALTLTKTAVAAVGMINFIVTNLIAILLLGVIGTMIFNRLFNGGGALFLMLAPLITGIIIPTILMYAGVPEVVAIIMFLGAFMGGSTMIMLILWEESPQLV